MLSQKENLASQVFETACHLYDAQGLGAQSSVSMMSVGNLLPVEVVLLCGIEIASEVSYRTRPRVTLPKDAS